ncbi:hypothetical protein EPD83_019970, partial [Phycicoccus sp. CMS6Z-2]|nr:hypothetical protein [Phycicoccus flavus]
IRRMPAPGSAAERAYHDRLRRKGKAVPGEKAVSTDGEVVESTVVQGGQRVQPKSKKRAKGAGPRVANGQTATSPDPGDVAGTTDDTPTSASDGTDANGSGYPAASGAVGSDGPVAKPAGAGPGANGSGSGRKKSKKKKQGQGSTRR